MSLMAVQILKRLPTSRSTTTKRNTTILQVMKGGKTTGNGMNHVYEVGRTLQRICYCNGNTSSSSKHIGRNHVSMAARLHDSSLLLVSNNATINHHHSFSIRKFSRPIEQLVVKCQPSQIVATKQRTVSSSSRPPVRPPRDKNTRNSNNHPKSSKHNASNLVNEDLISYVLKKSKNASSADDVSVRVVIDATIKNHQRKEKNDGNDDEEKAGSSTSTARPSQPQIMTLSNAVQLSLDYNADLLAASLDSDPPVIRLASISKLQYEAEQQKRQQQSKQKEPKKSFRFQAGIAKHDLQRKIAQMITFLQQKRDCEYTVIARARTLRENPLAGQDLVDQIQTLIAEYAVWKRPPETNDTQSFFRVQLEPKSNPKT